MRIVIHRGCAEIGGTCVEVINHVGESLLLDIGERLDGEDCRELPATLRLDNRILGVLISHAHRDHFGLFEIAAKRGVPVYLSAVTKDIINTAAFWIKGHPSVPENAVVIAKNKRFTIGAFTVTAIDTDHTYDSVSFLIECGGKRIYYTGDFRGHGRTAYKFDKIITNNRLKNIDALITEGTSAGNESSHSDRSEDEVQGEIEEYFRDCEGLALVSCSSQNFDRIVSVIRASNKLGRRLVIDAYTLDILTAMGHPSAIGALKNAKIFIPLPQRLTIKDAERFEWLRTFYDIRVFDLQKLDAKKSLMIMKGSSLPALDRTENFLCGAKLCFSMWSGYFERDTKLTDFIKKHNIETCHIHTSGHAGKDALAKLIAHTAPKLLLPVHTAHPEIFRELCPNTVIACNGETVEI